MNEDSSGVIREIRGQAFMIAELALDFVQYVRYDC